MSNPSELLLRLNSALSKVYGNTLLTESSKQKEELFKCDLCKDEVTWEAFNTKYNVCYRCFYEEGR